MTLMDTSAKVLSESSGLGQVTWSRFVFHTMWLTPFVIYWTRKRGERLFSSRRDILGHLIRGILIALSTAFYFAAIRENPIPDTVAVFFISPMFAMILAAIFLGEKLRGRRILAAVVAFIGVLVVLRPGGGNYTSDILLAPLAGLTFAGYIVATRASSMTGSPLVTAWGTSLAGVLVVLPWAIWDWQPLDTQTLGLMLLMGVFAASGHLCVSFSCRMASASIVSIFHYSEIIAATFVSYLVFRHIPDSEVWFGFALIAGAKIVLTVLEYKEGRKPAQDSESSN